MHGRHLFVYSGIAVAASSDLWDSRDGIANAGDTLLSWADTKKNAAFVRQLGVQQFIAAFKRGVQRKEDPFKWGDEVSLWGHEGSAVVYLP